MNRGLQPLPSRNYVAQLTPAQKAAHERIMALQQVYDAAVAVVKADQVVSSVPDFPPAQELLDETLSHLDAVIWNTHFILKEPYDFMEDEIKEAEELARARQVSAGVQKSLGLSGLTAMVR
jgi:hypothetical protein